MLPALIRNSNLAIFTALALASAVTQAASLNPGFLVDGVANGVMTEGKPAKWEFTFRDSETGATPHHFHVMHAKPMHLIVVSEDLSHFAHVHPENKPHSSKPFFLNANSVSQDPDNFAVPTVVPFSGKYFLFGEVMPMEYGMLLFPYDLLVQGAPREAKPLSIDGREADGMILKAFDDGRIRAKLFIEAMEHCGVILPKFNLELEALDSSGTLAPVQDLEPWLESYGHAIVVGKNGASAASKIVQHLHAVWPIPTDDIKKDERGPFIELAAHSHGNSTPTDIYKAWIQFKRAGTVHTLDFTFDWNLEKARGAAVTDGAFCFTNIEN